jgi:hypothetical protein
MLTELNILLTYKAVFSKFVVTNAPQNGACQLLITKQKF